MASLRHPNIVGFLGLCTTPPCVASEYCARGSLTDVLRRARSGAGGGLDWARRLSMALDAAKGMLYLHSHSPAIVHRDLKSPNLLVDKHWRVKISDFNLSKLLDDSPVMSSLAATNPRWLAPEILTGHPAAFASDVYAFGIVLWEVLTWELPWPTSNPWQVVTLVTEGGRLPIPAREALPGADTKDFRGLDAFVGLVRDCWAQNANDRPAFGEVIQRLRDLLESHLRKPGDPPRPQLPGSPPRPRSDAQDVALASVVAQRDGR
ncbi:protein tyrosine kinase [Helicosporidium sp. ATCC 50920]|nr:protein tyrosine kinase [Helicosporidium sp. ATCC 50920]|eukprot:KDD73320.1 protein tyrosine kinase [Helicosporidium sp. ATCC 50920]